MIGDRVWLDVNGDGLFGSPIVDRPEFLSEPGLAGVTVTLLNGSGAVLQSTTTDPNGLYALTNLGPGTYVLSFTLPPGYLFTTQNAFGNTQDGNDSDVDPATGATAPFALGMGEVAGSIDGGALAEPKLAASKRAVPGDSAVVRAGDRITYTIWVTNLAQTAALLVPITDSIPGGTSFVEASAVPALASGPDPLVWSIPALQPNAAYSVTFSVAVGSGGAQTSISNTATVGNMPVTQTNEVVHVFAPTAIQLLSLTAARAGGSVRVAWAVADEVDTLGYRVLRGASAERGGAQMVSGGLIAASGTGGSYAWVDAAAPSGAAFYWVEEVEVDGQTVTDYGPVRAPAVLTRQVYLPTLMR